MCVFHCIYFGRDVVSSEALDKEDRYYLFFLFLSLFHTPKTPFIFLTISLILCIILFFLLPQSKGAQSLLSSVFFFFLRDKICPINQEMKLNTWADEYEMEDIDDDMDGEFHGRDMGGTDSDIDEFDCMNNKMEDTSAAEARRGKDIQGIPWERLSITREKYRQTRLEQYKNYENIPQSGEASEKECKATKKVCSYYEFRRNSRSVKSTILHFQLRNLVWATSKHDMYFMSHFSVMNWSSLTCSKQEVLNVSGHVAPRRNILEAS